MTEQTDQLDELSERVTRDELVMASTLFGTRLREMGARLESACGNTRDIDRLHGMAVLCDRMGQAAEAKCPAESLPALLSVYTEVATQIREFDVQPIEGAPRSVSPRLDALSGLVVRASELMGVNQAVSS